MDHEDSKVITWIISTVKFIPKHFIIFGAIFVESVPFISFSEYSMLYRNVDFLHVYLVYQNTALLLYLFIVLILLWNHQGFLYKTCRHHTMTNFLLFPLRLFCIFIFCLIDTARTPACRSG